jgi:error-prone DNA polymerase
MESQRRAVMAARLMLIEGEIQRSQEGVVHLMARRITDRTAMLDTLSGQDDIPLHPARGDEVHHPQRPYTHGHPRDARIMPKSRDFH